MSVGGTKVTVGSSTTKVLDANGDRRLLVLTNMSDEVIWLGLGEDAVVGEGIPLAANGGNLEDEKLEPSDRMFVGQVNAICASGGKDLAVQELDWQELG